MDNEEEEIEEEEDQFKDQRVRMLSLFENGNLVKAPPGNNQ